MDLTLQTKTFGSSDQSFVVDPDYAGKVGCTIDLALIDSATLADWETTGLNAIKAGVALGIDPATKVCALWNTGVVIKQQTITRTSTGGTVDFAVDGEIDGGQLKSVVAATTAANIATYLAALPNVVAGQIAVTGAAGGPWVVTGDIGTITVDNTNATGGTVTIAQTTPEADSAYVYAGILWDDVPFQKGARTGKVGGSRIVNGIVYLNKLPLHAAAAGTPGKVDAAAIAEPTVAIAYVA